MVRPFVICVTAVILVTGCSARKALKASEAASQKRTVTVYPITREQADQVIYEVFSQEAGAAVEPLPEPAWGYSCQIQANNNWCQLAAAAIPIVFDSKGERIAAFAFEFNFQSSAGWNVWARDIFNRILLEASKLAPPIELLPQQVAAGRRNAAEFPGLMMPSISEVRLGMTRDNVVRLLGEPAVIEEGDGIEYLIFKIPSSQSGLVEAYFVGFRNGVVETVGRADEPEEERNVVNEQPVPSSRNPLGNGLENDPGVRTLKQLRQEGKITETQYQQMLLKLLERR